MTTRKLLSIVAIATLTIAAISCKKNETTVDEIETTFELSNNQAVAENLNQDASDVIEEATARQGLIGGSGSCVNPNTMNWIGQCATVTSSGNFPAKNIKIDFGTGCTGANGVVRKGVINVLLTDSLRKTGSVATITFDNYYVNSFKKEGTITRTNTTVAGSGTRSYNRKVTDGKITSADGKFWLHNSDVNITQIAGVNTPCDITDDVYTIEGARTVTNANGKTRTCTTQTPLQKKTNCNNIDQGILKIQGPNHFAIVDFGTGTCDNLATVSIDGRPARTVVLR